MLLQSHPIEDEAQHHPEICHKILSSRSCLPRQPSLKDFSERAVEFTLIPLIHPQPPRHTTPPPPVCTRHMYFVFQSPNIMHNAPRFDQRSARTASNIIANGKCAVERRNDSPHVLQLAHYYSVYFFCPPLPSSRPTTLPF